MSAPPGILNNNTADAPPQSDKRARLFYGGSINPTRQRRSAVQWMGDLLPARRGTGRHNVRETLDNSGEEEQGDALEKDREVDDDGDDDDDDPVAVVLEPETRPPGG
mmetsp:Transcript_20484/g.81934  ORF Transcript_20484/g.81934 Transcript_20484/m.81934 type:complete len:107 (+) Transcript_20484:101-421(+)